MKKNVLSALICISVFSYIFFNCGNVNAGIVTNKLPLSCYAEHFVHTYDNPDSQNIIDDIPAKVTNILIKEIRSDGWAYGKYRGSQGNKVHNWFRINDLCADENFENKEGRVKIKRQKVTRTRNSKETIGVVTIDDSVLVIAKHKGMAQIVYKAHVGIEYQMGWVPITALEIYK